MRPENVLKHAIRALFNFVLLVSGVGIGMVSALTKRGDWPQAVAVVVLMGLFSVACAIDPLSIPEDDERT